MFNQPEARIEHSFMNPFGGGRIYTLLLERLCPGLFIGRHVLHTIESKTVVGHSKHRRVQKGLCLPNPGVNYARLPVVAEAMYHPLD